MDFGYQIVKYKLAIPDIVSASQRVFYDLAHEAGYPCGCCDV